MPDKNISFIVDEWRFVPNEGQIQFADSLITIDNRLAKLLEFLCMNPGLTHSRDELIEEVWNGSVLTDQVVTQAVFELRKVLKKHSESKASYIITVPKRGYRFDGEVKVEKISVPKPEASEEMSSEPEFSIAGRRISEKMALTPPKPNRLVFLFSLLVVVIVAQFVILISYQQDDTVTPAPQKANHLSHYEFRYAVLNVSEEVRARPELYGMVIKFIEHVGFYSNIRVVKSEEHRRLAASEFNFSTAMSRDGSKLRLLMKYHNRVSGQTHLNRRYSTNFGRFHETFPAMIDDLMRAMYIEVPEDELKQNVSVFPKDEQAIISLMSGTGVLYNNGGFDVALNHFRQAREYAPDNAYTISVSYIGEIMTAFTQDEDDKSKRIEQLNQKYSSALTKVLQKDKNPRVCEANAILALSESDPEKASKILLSIPYNQHTSLTYLLMAKAEEARGHTSGAKELYLQATQNTSSPMALTIAGPLFFDSNLDPLIDQLQVIKEDKDTSN